MSMPFYVSPEQLMKDRAEFARKGISRGRCVLVARCSDGIALIAENPSTTLHKIAEIYDRIGFAAVGKYNEFESLRQAGVRYADLRGYSYDRADVTARGLTNAYAQTLASVFTTESKPFEVEIIVAELGVDPEGDRIYRLSYDGSVADEASAVVIGGDSEAHGRALTDIDTSAMTSAEVLRWAASTLGADGPIPAQHIEAALLDRSAEGHRTFRRQNTEAVKQILGGEA